MPETIEADDDLTIQEVLREINLADPIPNVPPPAPVPNTVTQSPPQPAASPPVQPSATTQMPHPAIQHPVMQQPPLMIPPQPYPAYPAVVSDYAMSEPVFSTLLKTVVGEVHLSLLIVAIVVILRMGFVQRFLVDGIAARINLPHIHAVSEVVVAVIIFLGLKYATNYHG